VDFPIPGEDLCERCRSVFLTLDMADDVCHALGNARRRPRRRAPPPPAGPGAPRRRSSAPARSRDGAAPSPQRSVVAGDARCRWHGPGAPPWAARPAWDSPWCLW
jgi:hypothetical protein